MHTCTCKHFIFLLYPFSFHIHILTHIMPYTLNITYSERDNSLQRNRNVSFASVVTVKVIGSSSLGHGQVLCMIVHINACMSTYIRIQMYVYMEEKLIM
jgi:hypothetical protein